MNGSVVQLVKTVILACLIDDISRPVELKDIFYVLHCINSKIFITAFAFV